MSRVVLLVLLAGLGAACGLWSVGARRRRRPGAADGTLRQRVAATPPPLQQPPPPQKPQETAQPPSPPAAPPRPPLLLGPSLESPGPTAPAAGTVAPPALRLPSAPEEPLTEQQLKWLQRAPPRAEAAGGVPAGAVATTPRVTPPQQLPHDLHRPPVELPPRPLAAGPAEQQAPPPFFRPVLPHQSPRTASPSPAPPTPAPPPKRRLRIAAVGDSLTQGCGDQCEVECLATSWEAHHCDYNCTSGYRGFLHRMLDEHVDVEWIGSQENGGAGMRHFGQPGAVMRQTVEQLQEHLRLLQRADVVLLHAGTNDMCFSGFPKGSSVLARRLGRMAGQFDDIVRIVLHETKSLLLIGGLLMMPRRVNHDLWAGYGHHLRSIAQRESKRVRFVDFVAETGLCSANGPGATPPPPTPPAEARPAAPAARLTTPVCETRGGCPRTSTAVQVRTGRPPCTRRGGGTRRWREPGTST
eukprot:TRINITY_DN22988_c0_g1_i1.p1 TRINITY_DN22988_c0_g1~~TRINITY_DN22988_c0_g1_i1.p1  ORF type:complete len:468 (+),score=49.86 TRINITY_DN22988_c0_g1_i1:76-1479(+)